MQQWTPISPQRGTEERQGRGLSLFPQPLQWSEQRLCYWATNAQGETTTICLHQSLCMIYALMEEVRTGHVDRVCSEEQLFVLAHERFLYEVATTLEVPIAQETRVVWRHPPVVSPSCGERIHL